MNLESFAIVLIDHAEDRLHPVARAEEGGEVADAQLSVGRAWRGEHRMDILADPLGPMPAQRQHTYIVERGAARCDARQGVERNGLDLAIAALSDLDVVPDGVPNLTEFEYCLGKIAACAERVRSQLQSAA